MNYQNIKINPKMKKLGARNYELIKQGVNSQGSFNPEEILFLFEEQLYIDECDTIILFLKWVSEDEMNRCFGSGNYEILQKLRRCSE